jgi:hypothetical protein
MPGNISQFLADIEKRGIAKTSHFDVNFSLPPILLPDTKTPEILTLRCESAELPGRQIVTTDNKIFGPIYKTPYQTMYADITMTFVDTADMHIRMFFEYWMNGIFDPERNNMEYLDSFMGNAKVTQYKLDGDEQGLNKTLQFNLINIFPTNINQLSTSWSDDSPHKLSVTFFYERYEIIEFGNPVFSTVDSLPQPQYMIEYPENEEFNDIQMNEMEQAKSRASDYMIEYPEDQKFNDIQMNEMQKAQTLAGNTYRTDTGVLGGVIQNIINKVRGL